MRRNHVPSDQHNHQNQHDQKTSARTPRRAPRAAQARSAPAAAMAAAQTPTTASPDASETPSGEQMSATPPSPPQLSAAPLLLTPAEAARMLRINRSTLYPMLMRGEIPSIRIGRARRIPVIALTEWIAQQVSEQQAQGGRGGVA